MMHQLKEILAHDNVRGVVRARTGELVEFHNQGVKDLFNLVESNPNFLNGACVADRVIGRGAALLLVLGKVKHVYAQLISSEALQVLNDDAIGVDYDRLVKNIMNRSATDVCPVEKLTESITQPDLAFQVIKNYLINNHIL